MRARPWWRSPCRPSPPAWSPCSTRQQTMPRLAGRLAGADLPRVLGRDDQLPRLGRGCRQHSGQRTRITAVREGFGLVGVVIAAAPGAAGQRSGEGSGGSRGSSAVAADRGRHAFARVRRRSRRRRRVNRCAQPAPGHGDSAFRRLLAVFVANGIAAAIPATLVLFFVADVLQVERPQGLFLALYFVAGAASHAAVGRLSAASARCEAWLAAWCLAIVAFVGAAFSAGRPRAVRGDLRRVGAGARRRPRLAAVDRRRSSASAGGGPAPTSACGPSRPSSTWRSPPGSRCRCWPSLGYGPARGDGLGRARLRLRPLPCALKALFGRLLSRWRALHGDPQEHSLLAAASRLAALRHRTSRSTAPRSPRSTCKRYFNGTVDGWGMFQDRSGKVAEALPRAHRRTLGRRHRDARRALQVLRRQDAEPRLDRQERRPLRGTAGDVVGEARARRPAMPCAGATCWRCRSTARSINVDLDDWMFLIDDQVMLNRS